MTKRPNILNKLPLMLVLIVVSVIAAPHIKAFFMNLSSETNKAVQQPQLLRERQAQQQADKIKDKIKKELDRPEK